MSGFGPIGGAPLGATFAPTVNFVDIAIADTLGVTSAVSAETYRALGDALALHAEVLGLPGVGVGDRFNLGAAVVGVGQFSQLIADNAAFRDAAVLAWDMALSDELSLADDVVGIRAMAVAIADRLLLTGAVGTQLEGMMAVIAGLALADTVGTGFEMHVGDSVDLSASLIAVATLLAAIEDTVTLAADAVGSARITVLLTDALALSDAATSQLTTVQAISDGLTVGATLRIGDESYFAWVLHPLPVDKAGTRPVTQYQHWPFNSHAQLGQKFYGAGPGGFFELAGTDDAGADIDGWVRSGLSDLGTSRRKRLPEVLFAIDGEDNAIYLKVRHVDPATGTLIEDWYDLIPETRNDAGVTREQRGKLQRGLKATWWGYEIRNRAGAPFKAANLRFYPAVLDGSS